MPKIFCATMDCEFNGDDGKCHAKEVALSDHSVRVLWEGRQRYQKCKTYQKSREATEMEQFFTKAVAEAKEKWTKEDERELVMCKDCWKRGLDNCPMEFYWDNHPADDLCYCAMGERREDA